MRAPSRTACCLNRPAYRSTVSKPNRCPEATGKHATPAQIALARLLAQKPWIVPIPDTTRLHRLEENLGAAPVELTSNDLRDIDQAASQITIQGHRYPESMQRLIDR